MVAIVVGCCRCAHYPIIDRLGGAEHIHVLWGASVAAGREVSNNQGLVAMNIAENISGFI